MNETNFIDYVTIYFRSGKGGAGSRHFLRTRTNPRGGPDGGDGGRGGHVVFKGNRNLWTLLHLKYNKHIIAENGGSGSGNNKTGADGKDAIVEVPLGTVVKDSETGELLTEITNNNEEKVILQGGRGGKGNTFFKSSTHQAPKFSQPGERGTEKTLTLELKILADVGLVGFPNAGKSTLLSVLSAAKPKIADYPFTTLVPNLGIVKYRDDRSFVMADIPGIIEGASEGKGLGHRFLRHIERNSMLLFMIPADSDEIKNEYLVLVNELEEYNPELLDKKRLLAVTKSDMLDEELMQEMKKDLPQIPYLFISSVAHSGLVALNDRIWYMLNE